MSDFGERIRAFNVLFDPKLPQAWADGATELDAGGRVMWTDEP